MAGDCVSADGYRYIGQALALPEPATWTLWLLAPGGLGWRLRSRV